jgi:hypothetical protein
MSSETLASRPARREIPWRRPLPTVRRAVNVPESNAIAVILALPAEPAVGTFVNLVRKSASAIRAK